MDTDALWNAANDCERKVLVNEIIEAVIAYPDRLQVAINGAPPINVAFSEVGLREAQRPPLRAAGTTIYVSKGGNLHLSVGAFPLPCWAW